MVFGNFNYISFSSFLILLFFGGFLIYRIYFNNFKKYKLSHFFLFLSLFFLLFCIFEPKSGFYKDKGKIDGVNIAFVLDISKSMYVSDFQQNEIKFSRLELAKKFILYFISNNLNNKYALSIFSGEASQVLPLTSDFDLYSTILNGISNNNVSKNGTDIFLALKSSFGLFPKDVNNGLIVLFSDGGDENLDINKFEYLKKSFKEKNISLVFIGVGTDIGKNIPIGKDSYGDVIYKVYNGKRVISKLNENNLKKISDFFDGKYYKFDDISKKEDLSSFLSNLGEKTVFYKELDKRYDETRFFVFVSFFFFLLSFLIKFLWLKK